MQGNAQREQVKKGGRNVDNEEMNKKEEWKRRGTGEMTCGEIQKEGMKEGRKHMAAQEIPRKKMKETGTVALGRKGPPRKQGEQ